MSDYLPFEIQAEIMKWFPVRSLIQFRSISKAWKSHIESSDFIAHYSRQQQIQPQHLLVSYTDSVTVKRKYVSIVDDHSFPKHMVYLTAPLGNISSMIGTSHGLFCLYGDWGRSRVTGRAVIWNPSIRKFVDVIVPNVGDGIYRTILGFGVCRESTDPKILKITYFDYWKDMESITSIPWQVEVFTLKTGAWRSLYGNLPRKSIGFGKSPVVVDGVLYWLVTDRITMDGGSKIYNLIISFDLTREQFEEVKLPDTLADYLVYYNLSLSKWRESLVVLKCVRDSDNQVYGLWMMGDGAPSSFTKMFSINTPHLSLGGFRRSGEPIIETVENLGISGGNAFSGYPYVETLLLLDQPDFIIYEKGNHYIARWRAKSKRLLKHTSKA